MMELSKYIDHTLLKPEATKEQIIALCEEAKEYNFASVCVNSCYVPLCSEILKDSDIKVCSVIGFPLGQMSAKAKVFEALNAVSNGADEIDMVINIGMLKGGNLDYVENEIRAIKKEIGRKIILKVIIETCLLTDEEKVAACKCAVKAGADFVKTSTGFSKGGATVEDVKLMKNTVSDFCQVKAAGGIRTKEDMLAMIEAGASRIGTSSGPKLL